MWADYTVCVTLAPMSDHKGGIQPDYVSRAALGRKQGLGPLKAGMYWEMV